MSLVNKPAPKFKTSAILNGEDIVDDFSLEQYIGKNEVVFFFYPKDFTFVCPTEILAFQELLPEFEKRGVKVVGASTDTAESHWAWLNTAKDDGGIQGVNFPIVADVTKTVATNFGVLDGEYEYNEDGQLTFNGAGIAFRGTFLIDKEGIVRHEYINFFPLGRNVNDTLRIVDAWKFFLEKGEVCPANWEEGKDGMKESFEGVREYLSSH